MKYVFGPVSSKRLGQSLGVDLLPPKSCTWNCLYCQLGKTRNFVTERQEFFPREEILEKQGKLSLELDGKLFGLLREDVEIMHEDIEGWLVASDEANGIMVALDTEMTEELEMQGLSRELVSRIQTLRKESGFEITDRIKIYVRPMNEKLWRAIESNEAYIKAETLALSIEKYVGPPKDIIYLINDQECGLLLEKYAS